MFILILAVLIGVNSLSFAAPTKHTSVKKKHTQQIKIAHKKQKKSPSHSSNKKSKAPLKHKNKKSTVQSTATKHTVGKHSAKHLHKKHTKLHSKKKHSTKRIVKRINKPNIPDHSDLPENVDYALVNENQAKETYSAKEITSEIALPSRSGLVASLERRLVHYVHKSVATLRYSAYKLGGTHFDTSRGVYIVDCSAYVDHTLRAVYPNAYSSLVNSTGSDKPNTLNYYNFFTELSEDSNEHWSRVKDVEKLRPGDILVFRYKNSQGNITSGGGHVMVVMKKPVRDEEGYLVSVADSAPVGHSEDTRSPNVSGIGIGTLVLKVNPKTGHPSAYAWKVGSRWKHNVSFAMARPLDIQSQETNEV